MKKANGNGVGTTERVKSEELTLSKNFTSWIESADVLIKGEA